MPNHLSILGIIHTAISILAIIAAIAALLGYGKIDPKTTIGKTYILLTIITCITALPIMKTGHLTAGHYLAVLILALLPVGIYAKQLRIFGKLADYVQVIVLSATLFFSFIPAIVETLTRLPISHPLAADPNAPIIQTGLLTLVTLFVIGVIYQVIKLRAKKKIVETPDSTIKFS
ncbi:MAG TPA: hypothetical protein VGC01_08525 [Mucilaginibacter sp.]